LFVFCRDAIVAWITKKLGPGVQNITTADEAERIVPGDDTAVLAFLESLSVRHLPSCVHVLGAAKSTQ
jgi:protein disulfide-isomerase A1